MNKTLTAAALTVAIAASFFAGPATAGDQDTLNPMKLCNSIQRLATTLMDGRQIGVSMEKYMAPTVGMENADILQGMVISAYDVPRYSTEKFRTRAVEDFANEQYLSCIKSTRNI